MGHLGDLSAIFRNVTILNKNVCMASYLDSFSLIFRFLYKGDMLPKCEIVVVFSNEGSHV